MIAYEKLKPGMVLQSENHRVVVIGTLLPKYPEKGEVLPVALAQTDFSQEGHSILAYTLNRNTREGCLRPFDGALLANPGFQRDFKEVSADDSASVRKELLEQALADVSGNYIGCDPCLFHILNFGQVKSDIEKILNENQ